MRTPPAPRFVPLGLALLVGCATATPPGAAPAVEPATREAAALHRACGHGAPEDRMACYDRGLHEALERSGTGLAMAALEALGPLDETVKREGHMLAHSLGLASYTTADAVGRAFRQCSPVFQSGCYHGVIQAYFLDRAARGGEAAVDGEAINAVCGEYRPDPSARWLLFQCAHGEGHGLTMFYGHDLPRALGACDLLHSPWERTGCYGGAFMENVMEGTSPHHAIGRPDEGAPMAMAHEGMRHGGTSMPGMDHGAPASGWKPLDPADPTYPCSAVEARYRDACWQMQTSAILYFNHEDVAATAEVCASLAEGLRGTCYRSLGRDVSALTLQDPARAGALCSAVGAAHRADCYTGFVKNVVDVSADAERGMAACRAAAEPDVKRACYRAVREEAWVLTDDSTRWEALCREAEPEYRTACEAAGEE